MEEYEIWREICQRMRTDANDCKKVVIIFDERTPVLYNIIHDNIQI